MRVKFMKYGKRAIGTDGASEYFEASVEVGPMDNPSECAQKAKEFVRQQLYEAQDDNLKASLADHLRKQ